MLANNTGLREQKPTYCFSVVCLVAWPVNESEAGGDLVWIEALLPFLCKLLLITMRTALISLRISREVSIKTRSSFI